MHTERMTLSPEQAMLMRSLHVSCDRRHVLADILSMAAQKHSLIGRGLHAATLTPIISFSSVWLCYFFCAAHGLKAAAARRHGVVGCVA